MQKRFLASLIATGAAFATLPCGTASFTPATPPSDQTANLVGAGDIADCRDLSGAEATAKLLDKIPGTVMAVGDLAYPNGSKENFACYDKTWGRAKSRTRPAPGNPKTGYYSYELGTWHIIVLNSECKDVGGCEAGSPQEKWLRADLAAHPAACTLAYWHKPLFSSGSAHGNDPTVKPFWQALYEANADVVVAGHDHDYERFAPQTPDAAADPVRGIREFVAGTGGKNHRPFGEPKPNSELRDATAFGVLKLTFKPGAYDWQFIPEAGKTFTDSGTGTCH